MHRQDHRMDLARAFTHSEASLSDQDFVEAFHRRQAQDLRRVNGGSTLVHRRHPQKEFDGSASHQDHVKGNPKQTLQWADSDGDRLHDFGVDEEAEFDDTDDVPLAELQQRLWRGSPNSPQQTHSITAVASKQLEQKSHIEITPEAL